MNQCAKCETEYDGRVCPECGLLWHPRCPDCGARIYFRETGVCGSCGRVMNETDYFEK